MPAITFPDGDAVGAWLVANGYAEEAPADASTYAAAAQKNFLRRVGWNPFLAEVQSHRFDPPMIHAGEQELVLEKGLLLSEDQAIEIRTGVSGTSDGTLLTYRTDYVFEPEYGGVDETPYTSVRFLTAVGGGLQSIKIDALYGYCVSLPEDIYLACLREAGALWLESDIASGAKRIKQGPVEYELVESHVSTLHQSFISAASRCRL